MSSEQTTQYTINGFEAIVRSESMRHLMQMVERAARSSASVLITGETGSGKEFVARALHHYSSRCSKPWIDLNCAALPEHLVESELFGYEKGAFSGADTGKAGLFELATGGTLFLDEIGELEPKIQVKLLRVLDGIPYFRLGGNRKVSVDVRVIAATNQDLDAAVKTGRFRGDLYHRLGQLQLRIPPLRERPEDLEALAEYFLQQFSPGARFSSSAMAILRGNRWTGNVRELRNVVMQASMSATGSEIKPSDLPPEPLLTDNSAAPAETSTHSPNTPDDLDEIEKQTILRTLVKTGGHQGMAADLLGISRRTLSRKLKHYNLNRRAGDHMPLGELDAGQQQHFRVSIELAVTLTTARGENISLKATNLSAGGICVEGFKNPKQLAGALAVHFALPDTGAFVSAKAQVAWTDVQKRAGLRFVDLSSDARDKLDRWLQQQQQAEGWTLAV